MNCNIVIAHNGDEPTKDYINCDIFSRSLRNLSYPEGGGKLFLRNRHIFILPRINTLLLIFMAVTISYLPFSSLSKLCEGISFNSREILSTETLI